MKLHGNLDLLGGQQQNQKVHTYPTLPAFSAGSDEGRVIYVTTGDDLGYWFGAEDGSASFSKLNFGTTVVEYDLPSQAVANGVTHQASVDASTVAALIGILLQVELSANLASGLVRVELFEDSGRTRKFYSNVFDLSNLSVDHISAGFNLANADGILYVDVTNLTGSDGVFTLNVQTAGVLTVQTPPPPGDGSGVNAGVAGDGISYDSINAQLQLDLDTNPGLQLVGSAGDRKLSVRPSAGGGLTTTSNGLEADSTILRTTGAQTAAGNKSFTNGVAIVPAGSSGPPVAGTYARGTFYVDQDDDVWYCTVGGTPGTWIFWGWKIVKVGGETDGSSYTGTVTAGSTEDLVVQLKGRRGLLRRMLIWGSDPAFGVSDIDAPFRLSAYVDENYEGRDQIWSVIGQVRKTNITGAVAASPLVPVTTVNIAEVGDLLRLRTAATDEEYGRIITRSTAPVRFTLDEDAVEVYANNDVAMYVAEFGDLSWFNTSAVPANQQKLYLRFHNDHASQSLVFGYELWIESVGGGAPL